MAAEQRVEDSGERTRKRIELAAALLQYDDETDAADDEPFARALSSAILSPYRGVFAGARRQRSTEDERYFETVVTPLGPDGARPQRETAYEQVQARYARSTGGSELGLENDLPISEEWGMTDYLSQLGSGSLAGIGDGDTRSQPDRLQPEPLEPDRDEGPDVVSPPSRLLILERDSTAPPRLHTRQSSVKLDLSPFPSLFETDGPDQLAVRPRHRRGSSALDARPPSRLSNAVTDELDAPRSRRMSASSLTIATRLSQADAPELSAPMSRAGSRMSQQTTDLLGDDDASLAGWTSRFDPTMLIKARQEIEKDRPVFASKSAGAPPRLVIMPAPLAGQPKPAYKRQRTEGPDEPSLETEVEVEEEKVVRPAGTLFGRSLMDVLVARQGVSKQRSYTSQPLVAPAIAILDPDEAPVLEGAPSPHLTPPKNFRRSRSALSVFGPDLLYARDLEKVRLLEIAEAETRRVEEEEEAVMEAAMWEKERIKQERKTLKSRKRAAQKLEGRTGPIRDSFSGPTFPAASAMSSLVPSISMPKALAEQAGADQVQWFPVPPPAPSSPASSVSSHHQYDKHQSMLDAVVPPLVPVPPEDSNRTAVMMGFMSPRDAAAAQRSTVGSPKTSSGDHRALGEMYDPGTYDRAPPPRADFDEGPFISSGERADLSHLGHEMTPPEDDEDDVPLGVRHPQMPADDDDMPLAFNHLSLGRHASPLPGGDDDDLPLGFVHHAAAYQHQQDALQSQQNFMFAASMQQQQMLQHQQHQHMLMLSMGIATDSGFGQVEGGGSVERWRRDIG